MLWILVVRPPRERPIAWFFSPLFRPKPSDGPSRRSCRSRLARAALRPAQARGTGRPRRLCRPADIAVVEGFPRPVFWRSVDPATAGPQHIDDPADHPTISGMINGAESGGRWIDAQHRLRAEKNPLQPLCHWVMLERLLHALRAPEGRRRSLRSTAPREGRLARLRGGGRKTSMGHWRGGGRPKSSVDGAVE